MPCWSSPRDPAAEAAPRVRPAEAARSRFARLRAGAPGSPDPGLVLVICVGLVRPVRRPGHAHRRRLVQVSFAHLRRRARRRPASRQCRGSLSAVQQLAAAIGSAVVTTVYFSRRPQYGAAHAMTVSVAVMGPIALLDLGLVWLLPKSAPPEPH